MHVVSRALLRAPLLPARALHDPAAALLAHPLGETALRLASPSLAGHADARAARARRRYGKRAAFRCTPHGLWAGVAVADLTTGPSEVDLGDPEVAIEPSFARWCALGRALLDSEAGWRAARLRRAPSLVRDELRAIWIAFGEGDEARRLEADLDPVLRRVLDATAAWIAAPALARRLRPVEAVDAWALLLDLVDDGLLQHDLEPPLVGPPPGAWARARLAGLCPAVAALADDRGRPAAARLDDASRILTALPGHDPAGAHLHATLIHRPRAARIDRAAVARAAQVAPLLVRLAEALAPPAREAVPGLDDLFAAASAVVGEGLLPVAPIELGAYGAQLGGEPAPLVASPAVIAHVTGLVIDAARAGAEEIALDPAALQALLPPGPAPTSLELQLAPAAPTTGAPPGTDWLLGVHGPAGASWGRFAHALGEPMARALAELDALERADDDALRLDVAYAPSRALGDLCAVPALRRAALAVSSWPDGDAVAPEACALANDPLGPAHGGVVVGDRPASVRPLHRVRSTTAPPSAHRALLADTLVRQHAPWAFTAAAWDGAPWLPRVRLDGFVIAPQSWALPEPLDEAALAAWRRRARPPRHVLVGLEDALLPIDLDDPDERADLLALPAAERRRAYEIWPPLGRELDRGGRRLEIVCALVDEAAGAGRRARLAALRPCPPPAEAAAPGWRTVKIFAPRDRHASLLVDGVGPWLRRHDVRRWFFLPYVDPPGQREHLRLRLHARDDAAAGRLAARFADDLDRARGGVVAVEIGGYHPEVARYGEPIGKVEAVFQSDAELVLALLGGDAPDVPDEVLLAIGYDALAAGLGASARERRARCEEALAGYAIDPLDERARLAPAYRLWQRPLLDLLADPPPPFRAHRRRVQAARLGKARGLALLPALAHLSAVRLCGPVREAELRALYLWRRALASRAARR